MALFNIKCNMQCYLENGKCCEFFAYCQANQHKNQEKEKEKAIEVYLNDMIANTNNMYKKLNEQIQEVNFQNENIKLENEKIKKDFTKFKSEVAKNGTKNITVRNSSKK